MTTDAPLRIFIGTEESQRVPAQVLEHSIRKHATVPVEVVAMLDLPVPTPRGEANRPRTGFSLYRWMIPELCGFEGRALYLDADMIVFGDVAELAALPFDGRSVLCTAQREPPDRWRDDPKFRPGPNIAVLLLDCARLDWDVRGIVAQLDAGELAYRDLVNLGFVPADDVGTTIPVEWNHLERFEPGVTRLVHYTVVSTQPWRVRGNPLEDLWTSSYREAMAAGSVDPDTVVAGVVDGHLDAHLAAALVDAPAGSEANARALAALDDTRARLRVTEAKLDAMERSASWKLGQRIVRIMDAPRRALRSRP